MKKMTLLYCGLVSINLQIERALLLRIHGVHCPYNYPCLSNNCSFLTSFITFHRVWVFFEDADKGKAGVACCAALTTHLPPWQGTAIPVWLSTIPLTWLSRCNFYYNLFLKGLKNSFRHLWDYLLCSKFSINDARSFYSGWKWAWWHQRLKRNIILVLRNFVRSWL